LNRRVVVTGIGLVSCVGLTTEETWASLKAGRGGIAPITRFDTSSFRVSFAGEVKGFDPEKFLPKKDVKKMDAFIHYATAAAQEAMDDSGLRVTPEIAERVGTFIGSGIGGFNIIEREHRAYLEGGPNRISPFFIPAAIVNLASGHVSIRFGLKGPNSAPCTACSSGAHAVGDSFKVIQRGDADAMVCGGAEAAITPMGVGGFAAMRALSTRNDDPARASRPFDKERDGFVIGEGAGVLVLEELGHALARGAKIYAEVVGYGTALETYHLTAMSPEAAGPTAAIRRALADAGLPPERVGYVNAHGTSTVENDAAETLAIKNAFGPAAHSVPVSSTKSMTGHLVAAAGAVEAIFTVLALRDGVAPPTINYETPDPACDLDYVPNVVREVAADYALSNSFGFGGQNAALVLGRYTGAR
jgi:3-oxoacyl-[acyl-carrier-protein] synthase II